MRQFILALAVISAAIPITAQAQNQVRSFPKTPDGQPDLQGLWTNDTFTPLERPKTFKDKAFFTEGEQGAFQKEVRDHTGSARRREPQDEWRCRF